MEENRPVSLRKMSSQEGCDTSIVTSCLRHSCAVSLLTVKTLRKETSEKAEPRASLKPAL